MVHREGSLQGLISARFVNVTGVLFPQQTIRVREWVWLVQSISENTLQVLPPLHLLHVGTLYSSFVDWVHLRLYLVPG